MMDYVIKDIKSKRTDGWVNPCHADVLGKACKITSLMEGYSAMLMVDVEDNLDHLHYLHTSTVYSFEQHEDGCMVINTRNSIYTLEPIGGDVE